MDSCSIRQAARHIASIMAQRKVGKKQTKQSLGSIQKDEEDSSDQSEPLFSLVCSAWKKGAGPEFWCSVC